MREEGRERGKEREREATAERIAHERFFFHLRSRDEEIESGWDGGGGSGGAE